MVGMLRMSRVLVAAVCSAVFLLSGGAYLAADSMDWVQDAIKHATRDPGQLYYFHDTHSDCPIGDAHAEGIIDAVLSSRQIGPRHLSTSRALSDQLYLDLSVSCLDREDGSFVYSIDAYFAVHSPLGGERLLIARRFGRLGLGDRTSILQAVQESVEDAAAAFLTANELAS